MAVLFVSDIHVGAEHPQIGGRFARFLRQHGPRAERVYILGDLFEAWAGDDTAQPEHSETLAALRELTNQGIPVFVMHGNRDFLLGPGFVETTGCQLLPELSVIDLYGTPTLLLHGDSLCTDDTAYQSFRAQVRNPAWQQGFLAQPAEQRLAIARQYREASLAQTQTKAQAIMDVNADAVKTTLRQHGLRHMIHGHTHRPACHALTLDGAAATRIVLGDWYTQDSWLLCSTESWRLHIGERIVECNCD